MRPTQRLVLAHRRGAFIRFGDACSSSRDPDLSPASSAAEVAAETRKFTPHPSRTRRELNAGA
jgi:hypothetical protein